LLLGKEQNVIGHRPEHVRVVAEAHLAAYGADDIDVLMRTVSPRGGVWAGLAPPHGAALMRTVEEIRATYVNLLGAVRVGGGHKVVSVCTDWYVFMDGVTTVTDKASGRTMDSRSITLFGNDELGTAMDMAWPFGLNLGPAAADAAAATARTTASDLDAHKRRMAGWASGDVDAASRGVADACSLFLPCFDPDDARLTVLVRSHTDYRSYLRALFELFRFSDLAPSNAILKDNYILQEYALTATAASGGRTDLRYVLAEILNPAGEVHGLLGFATRAGPAA
jgi:hypothetical protein